MSSGTEHEPAASPVLADRHGSLGHLRINRPKALNSLTLPMVEAIAEALERFAADPAVASVLISGTGERGLCAGGDIRALHDSGRAGDGLGAAFWRAEYRVNARISRYPKPYIAFMDGITMGGGVGISAHGAHRLVTERTRLAMPETGIGFFPDVGGTWLLARAPGELGTWAGLTGEHLGAADAIAAGLADLHVPSTALVSIIAALAELPAGVDQAAVRACLGAFATPASAGVLAANRALIDRIFAADEVGAILAALAESDDPFAARSRQTLLTRSPTSLALTLRLLRLARTSPDLESCLEREFIAGAHVLAGHDFYEGVRAAIIDKDRNPRWSPADLSAVTPELIESYLRPLGPGVF